MHSPRPAGTSSITTSKIRERTTARRSKAFCEGTDEDRIEEDAPHAPRRPRSDRRFPDRGDDSSATRTAGCSRQKSSGILEGPDRDEWQQPDRVMDALGIADGSRVADLGAGGGWFTIRLAHRVGPNGLVYAEDIQREMIESIRRRVDREGLRNVRTILGEPTDPRLPHRSARGADRRHVPAVSRPGGASSATSGKALGPTGRLGIVDFKRDGSGGPGPSVEERIAPEAVERRRDGGRPQALQPGDVPSISIFAGFRHDENAAAPRHRRSSGRISDRVGRALEEFLPSDSTEVVVDCMRYTLLAPSKRVRAVLVLLTAELCGNASRARCRRPARSKPCTRRRSCSMTCRAWTTRRCAAAGRRRTSTYGEAVTILAAFGLLNAGVRTPRDELRAAAGDAADVA